MPKLLKVTLSLLSIVLVLVGILAFYLSGYSLALREYFNRDFQPNLEFSFSRCSTEQSAETVENSISKKWLSNGDLEIKAVVKPNCGTAWIFGGYRLNGSKLTLTYSPVAANIFACTCANNVEYVISNIPNTDYDVTIVEEGGIFEPPELLMWIMNKEHENI